MAWDPSKDPGWVHMQGAHPLVPSAPQVPVEHLMAEAQRLSLHPSDFNPQPSMNQYNWQARNNGASVFEANAVRGQIPFPQMGPAPYHLAGIPSIPQNTGFAPGIAMESPTVAFGPGSPPPIVDRVKLVGPSNHGVIKIRNIPYGITMAEVQQFMLKHITPPDLLQPHRDGFPFHIIMERSTGKTMDAFIEVQTPDIAADAVDRNFRGMKFSKLGQRHVNLELSSQAQLLKDLFPRARSVVWDEDNGGAPYLVENNDPYSSGFNSFVTEEELNGMIRHAETPQRSPFAIRSQQRPYESMVSTLYKFPWYADALYTMKDRDRIYSCYMRQLQVLVNKVDPFKQERREVGLDTKLLMEFIFAGMNCPAFSQRQKYSIVAMSAGPGRGVYLSLHARTWPFQCLTPDPATLPDQDVGMWLHIVQSGIRVMIRDCQGVENVVIGPYLGLELVDDYVVVRATDGGIQLSRQAFAALEEKFLEQALEKGWAVYLGQSGIAADGGNDDRHGDESTLNRPVDGSNSVPAQQKYNANPRGGQADISGPGPAVATDGHNIPTLMERANVYCQGLNDGRISTARRNSATGLPPLPQIPSVAPTQPQAMMPSTVSAQSRASRAIPIRQPDGTPIKIHQSETVMDLQGISAGNDGNTSTISDDSTSDYHHAEVVDHGICTPNDDMSTTSVAVVSPQRGLGYGNDRGHVPSGSSSFYNNSNSFISSVNGSPAAGTPPRMTPTRSAAMSANGSPSRRLRRVSGASVSPTKGSPSIVSYHVGSKTPVKISSSRDSSWSSMIEQAGINNPLDFTGSPGKMVSKTPANSPFMRAPDLSHSSPGRGRNYGFPFGAAATDPFSGDFEPTGPSIFDPGPIGTGIRSASASTTGTVIRRNTRFSPEENTIVEEEEGCLIHDFERGLVDQNTDNEVDGETTYHEKY